MDMGENISAYEQIFLALRKLAEDGLGLCEEVRKAAIMEGLVVSSQKKDSQQEFNARMIAKLLQRAERKKMKKTA